MNEFDFQEEVVKEEKPIDFLKYLLKILRRWPFILLFSFSQPHLVYYIIDMQIRFIR